MGGNAKTNELLKERMANALFELLEEKPLAKITVQDIVGRAGAGRASFFRNFDSKEDALRFKLDLLWDRWASCHEVHELGRFTLADSEVFFVYIRSIAPYLKVLFDCGLQSVFFDAFNSTMVEPSRKDAYAYYESRFYASALFGLASAWIERGFRESPEQMGAHLSKIVENPRTGQRA